MSAVQVRLRHERQFARFLEVLTGEQRGRLLLPEYGHLCDKIVGFATHNGQAVKEDALEKEYQYVSYAARLFVVAAKERLTPDHLRYFPKALVAFTNCTGILPRQMELAREIQPFLVPASKPTLATPRG